MTLDLEKEFRPTLLQLRNELNQCRRNDFKAPQREWMMDQVDAALRRMEENTYGICRDCFLVIPLAALLMQPYTEICPDCRRRRRAGFTTRNSDSRISSHESKMGKKGTGLRALGLSPVIIALVGIGLVLGSLALP